MVDFNDSMTRLVREIVTQVETFRHIRTEQLLISATFARSSRRAGLLAYVLPLKYRAGSPVERRVKGSREYHWAMLPTKRDGVEVLYILYFMLPRFLQMPMREKIETVVHELYHISPQFNGDLRRFRGRSVLHGSMQAYDRKVHELTKGFLEGPHDPATYAFLSHKSVEPGLFQAHHIPEPRPKLIKVALNPVSGPAPA